MFLIILLLHKSVDNDSPFLQFGEHCYRISNNSRSSKCLDIHEAVCIVVWLKVAITFFDEFRNAACNLDFHNSQGIRYSVRYEMHRETHREGKCCTWSADCMLYRFFNIFSQTRLQGISAKGSIERIKNQLITTGIGGVDPREIARARWTLQASQRAAGKYEGSRSREWKTSTEKSKRKRREIKGREEDMGGTGKGQGEREALSFIARATDRPRRRPIMRAQSSGRGTTNRPGGIARARRFILTIVNATNGERDVTLGDR